MRTLLRVGLSRLPSYRIWVLGTSAAVVGLVVLAGLLASPVFVHGPGAERQTPLASADPRLVDQLPLGTFQAARPFDAICVALVVAEATDATVAARWWNVGASGDCTTRTSDIVVATADVSDYPVIRLDIPTMGGGYHHLTLRVTGIADDEIQVARQGEDETSFSRIDTVSPTFAPVP